MNARCEILLAEDERVLRRALAALLERAGYAVRAAADGEAALRLYRERRPDLLLLDVMMPKLNGYDVCRTVRDGDATTPILFLTAKDTEAHEVRGLGAGADDFLSKSASEAVWLARIAAALRRTAGGCGDFSFFGWRVEPAALRMVSARGESAALTEREVAILRLLAAHPGEVFNRDGLLTKFWGADRDVAENTLSMAMARLREKLGADGEAIRTVRGVGYASAAKVRALVSLGSNLEPRATYLERAVAALAALPLTRLVQVSSVRETEPVDVPPEFAALKFLNQVAVFETGLEPLAFSRRMHAIEDSLGRVRTVRNGPRTIDIDLIDFGGLRLDTPELTLPHPRAKERAFVREPLEELGIWM